MHLTPAPALTAWTADRILALGWYDGPTEGLYRASNNGQEVWFEMLAYNIEPDDLDDRLFGLREVPRGTTGSVMEALAFLGLQGSPTCAPTWVPDGSERWSRAEQRLAQVEDNLGPTRWIVRSSDMERLEQAWRVDGFDPDEDWDRFLVQASATGDEPSKDLPVDPG